MSETAETPAAALEDDERAAIERACTQVSLAYALAVDSRDYDGFAALFTEDAVLDLGSARHVGRATIRAAMDQRPEDLVSRHVVSNILIEAESADEAQGVTYLTLYRGHSDGGPVEGKIAPAAVGHYRDRFRRTDEGWKLAERRLAFGFVDPARF